MTALMPGGVEVDVGRRVSPCGTNGSGENAVACFFQSCEPVLDVALEPRFRRLQHDQIVDSRFKGDAVPRAEHRRDAVFLTRALERERIKACPGVHQNLDSGSRYLRILRKEKIPDSLCERLDRINGA